MICADKRVLPSEFYSSKDQKQPTIIEGYSFLYFYFKVSENIIGFLSLHFSFKEK